MKHSTREPYRLTHIHLGDIEKSRRARGDAKAGGGGGMSFSRGSLLFFFRGSLACSQANYKLDRATIHR